MSTPNHQRTLPLPGNLPNIKSDALAAYQVLKSGGVVIVPTEVGYGIVSSSAEGIERAFQAKQRKPGHTLGIIGTYLQHTQLHVLSEDEEAQKKLLSMTRMLTLETGGVLALVSKYREDHPRLKRLSPMTMERITKNGTLGIGISDGPFLVELGRLNDEDEDGQLMMGSSANLSGQGQKFRIEDIEPEVLSAADLIIDYGLQRYHLYGRAGTILDLNRMKVLRIGAGYEVFREKMRRWMGIEFEEDPEWKVDGVKRVGRSIMAE